MEKGWVRTLVILTCGIAMALVAYAGQVGYKEDDPWAAFQLLRGESIRIAVHDGFLLDYRLVSPPASPEQPPELVLYLFGERQGLIEEASVVYRIRAPRGTELQAQAQPSAGSYQADIFFAAPGPYQVAAEIVTSQGTFTDRFNYEML